MNEPRNYSEKLTELKLVSEELNRMIGDGSFYRLSFAQRWTWIRTVKKLYNGLLGPVSSLKLRHVLAAAAVMVMGAGCPGPVENPPYFAPSTVNPFGLADVGGIASPCLADIDNDGDLDAFIGNSAGNTIYFQNTGTAAVPAFAASENNPFSLSDVGDWASPCFVDIDNDGDFDALIGNYEGNTLYYRNTGTSAVPVFTLTATPSGLNDVGSCAAPCFVDIDNDGDLDAFIGNSTGNILYFQNTGTAAAPAFDAPVTNPSGLTNEDRTASPCFVDIDNDGDLDAFIGGYWGGIVYFQNTGTASAPAFTAAVGNPFNLTSVNYNSSPCFVDIDNDGDLDGFVGDNDGNTQYFENTAR